MFTGSGKWAGYVKPRGVPGGYVPWEDPEGTPRTRAVRNAVESSTSVTGISGAGSL